MSREVHVMPDANALAIEAAEHWRERARAAIRQREHFSTALSGGHTPAGLYRQLAQNNTGINWQRVWVYFSDERCVPRDHADSNYRMANETLLSHIPLPPTQIFRMACESDPVRSADDYSALLAPLQPAADMPPVIDLILLGLGSDGHIASLFPGSAALLEAMHWVTAIRERTPDHARLSLTLPVLRAAREVMFLVSGRAKAQIVRQVLKGESQAPAARLLPAGEEHWFLDNEAASGLDR